MSRSTIDLLNVEVLKETKLALRIQTEEGKEHWIPKSVIDDASEVNKEGDKGTLTIHEWFAEKEGIE